MNKDISKKLLLPSLATFIAMVVGPPVFAHESDRLPGKLVIGVVPQYTPREIHDRWLPLVNELKLELKMNVEVKGMPHREAFNKALLAQEFDLVYLNPYDTLKQAEMKRYFPLMHDPENYLRGIIVVNKSSGIHTVDQLDGERVDFPSATSFGATLLTLAHLEEKNVHVRRRFVQSHTAVYLNVALGQAIAGGGIASTLEQSPPDVRERLKIIYTSATYPSHAISVSSKLSQALRHRIQNALFDLHHSDSGRNALARLNIKRLSEVSATDYQPIGLLHLERIMPESP